MVAKSGKFIVFEGGEGTGKSTNLALLQNWLAEQGIAATATREPGGTPLAEQIRNLLLAHQPESVYPLTELLLIFAARAQHIYAKILPHLQKGDWVLSDRFVDATFAYQGAGRQLPVQWIQQLTNWVLQDLKPDLVIVLDMSESTALQRATRRGQLDRFEVETKAFFARVRQSYLDRAKEFPQRYHVIDADQPLEAVQQEIIAKIKTLL